MSKTIDIRSLLIGFLLATSVMLFMGATKEEPMEMFVTSSNNGKYQVSTTYRDAGNWVFETIINTETGEIISR